MRPAAILAVLLAATPAPAPADPAFRCYPATPTAFHPPVRLHGNDSRTGQYADALSWALSHDPLHASGATAFAAALLAEIGCGAAASAHAAALLAAIDARTGAVQWLPASISDWPIKLLQPVQARPDSRLVVISGQLV